MKWIPDKTGLFTMRPHYSLEELDFECEKTITEFLTKRYQKVSFPIITDDLTVLIEGDTSDFDRFADLSGEGENVEGVTYFFPDKKPFVRIDSQLSEQTWREHRLRTTLTHEFGHVKLHAFMWREVKPRLMSNDDLLKKIICKKDTIESAPQSNWLEWQANYASSAYLMPISELKKCCAEHLNKNGLYSPLSLNSPNTDELVKTIAQHFDVSEIAAKIRLLQQKYLSNNSQSIPLF